MVKDLSDGWKVAAGEDVIVDEAGATSKLETLKQPG